MAGYSIACIPVDSAHGDTSTNLQVPYENLEDNGLGDVFRRHILPHLPLRTLAQLRATSLTLRTLVDIGSGDAWKEAGQGVLTPDTIPDHADGHAAQDRLKTQAAAMLRLRSGESFMKAVLSLQLTEFNSHNTRPLNQ